MRNLFDPAAYDVPETGVTFSCDNAALQAVFEDCERLLKQNVQDFGGRKVLIEGAAYRNVWLETQPMGGEMYAKRDVAVALQNILVFLQYQRRDGRYPGMLTWSNPTGLAAHYDWMQGFYLARQAYRLADWIGGDREYLALLASSLADFYAYLMTYRTGNPDGIPESWCVWDTGEDNCSRFLRYGAKDGYWAGEKPPVGVGRLPYRSMEYTAYACELAQVIGEIHARLGNPDAQMWLHRAEAHRHQAREKLWDAVRGACFDRDRDGKTLPELTLINMRCMHLGLFSSAMANTFIERHLLNPAEFWTALPLPSIAANDEAFRNIRGNNWSGPCQGLSWQRAIDALLRYDRHDLVVRLGHIWLDNLGKQRRYVQQYDPFTGEADAGVQGYGPTMLAALEYIAMLYGVVYRGERALLCACGGRDSTSYTQRIGERTIRLERKNGMMRAFLDGKAIYTGACGQCVEISMQGEVLSVKPIP